MKNWLAWFLCSSAIVFDGITMIVKLLSVAFRISHFFLGRCKRKIGILYLCGYLSVPTISVHFIIFQSLLFSLSLFFYHTHKTSEHQANIRFSQSPVHYSLPGGDSLWHLALWVQGTKDFWHPNVRVSGDPSVSPMCLSELPLCRSKKYQYRSRFSLNVMCSWKRLSSYWTMNYKKKNWHF